MEGCAGVHVMMGGGMMLWGRGGHVMRGTMRGAMRCPMRRGCAKWGEIVLVVPQRGRHTEIRYGVVPVAMET